MSVFYLGEEREQNIEEHEKNVSSEPFPLVHSAPQAKTLYRGFLWSESSHERVKYGT